MDSPILEMKNITKEFPGVKALNDVSFQVKEGEIHCLVGENGAGKSTLMKVLSGVYPYGSYSGDRSQETGQKPNRKIDLADDDDKRHANGKQHHSRAIAKNVNQTSAQVAISAFDGEKSGDKDKIKEQDK